MVAYHHMPYCYHHTLYTHTCHTCHFCMGLLLHYQFLMLMLQLLLDLLLNLLSRFLSLKQYLLWNFVSSMKLMMRTGVRLELCFE